MTSDDIKRTAATYLTAANRTVIDRKPVAKVARQPRPPAGDQEIRSASMKKLMLTLTISLLFAPVAYAAEP